EQVVLGVDPAQHLPLARDLLPVGREVAEPREEAARTVEVARDRVGAALDPPYERRVLALEPVPPLGPAGVVLALGARMAGVFPQTPAQRRELGIVPVGRSSRSRAAGRRTLVEPRSQPGRKVLAGLVAPRREAPGQGHLADRAHSPGQLVRDEPAHASVDPEHARCGTVEPLALAHGDDDAVAGAATSGHLDDRAGPQRVERTRGLGTARATRLAFAGLLEVGDRASQVRVLAEVAELALHGLRVALERL